MGLNLSKKKKKLLRSFRYKTPHGNFVIIVEESDTDTIGEGSLTTLPTHSESVSQSETVTESLDSNQSSSENSHTLHQHQYVLPKSVSHHLNPTHLKHLNSKNESLYSLKTQPITSDSSYSSAKTNQSLYSDQEETSALSSDPSIKNYSIRHSAKVPHDFPFKKRNDRLLFKLEYVVNDQSNKDQWALHKLPKSAEHGNKAFLLSRKCEPDELSRNSLTSEERIKHYKTKDDIEEELVTLSLNSKRVGPHCETCQCEYNTDHRSFISYQEEEKQFQSSCFGLPQKECRAGSQPCTRSSSSTLATSDSDSRETRSKLKSKKNVGKKGNHYITVAAVETKAFAKTQFEQIPNKRTPEFIDYLPEKIPKRSLEYLPEKIPKIEQHNIETDSSEYVPEKIPKRHQDSESSEYFPEKIPKKSVSSLHLSVLPAQSKPIDSETSDYCHEQMLPKTYPSTDSQSSESTNSENRVNKQSKFVTPKNLEKLLGIVLPNQAQCSYQLETCPHFKNSLKKPIENIISRDIMQEAYRMVSEQPKSSEVVQPKQSNTQSEAKRSYMDELILSNLANSSKTPEQVLVSIQSVSPNPLIVTLLQPMGPNELGPGKEPIPITPSEQNWKENYLSKQSVPLTQSEQVLVSIQSALHNPLAVTLLAPNQSDQVSKQPLPVVSSNQSEEIPLEQSKILRSNPSSKFVALLEEKYKKRFNTMDEIMLKPPRDVMLLMLTGEIPNLTISLKQPKGGAINYDDFLSSMKSGV